MGILAEQLKLLNKQLESTKESINNKYNIMDMPSIETLKVKEIPDKINNIPVLNTKDATVTPSDIIKDKVAYNNHEKVIGAMNDLCSDTINLETTNIDNLEFQVKDTEGCINSGTKFKLDKSTLARQIGLTSSIIKKGETILGVQGNYSGLETTDDANATASDIIKNKTAYVNKQKVTGSLLDYSNTKINTTTKLSGNSIIITLPTRAVYDKLSTISISLSKIAELINLTPDKIKNGEEVLGVIGNYTKPSVPEQIEPDINGNYVDYNTRQNFFHFDFKWGYWELLKKQDKYTGDVVNLYERIYNAYYYNGDCDGYYINGDDNTIYASTYNNHPNIKHALYCYVEDLNVTVDECSEVWTKVFYDCPELLIKLGSFYFAGLDKVKYIFLDSFDKSTMKEYKNTCLKTFNEISNIVKNTYGITYEGDSSFDGYASIDSYTSQEKFKITKVIHDFLVLNNVYGHSSIENLDQVMYPALSKGKYTPVCASYAKSFQWCCQKYGIFVLPIVGYAGERHMWNMVCYEKYSNSIVNAHNNSSVWNEVDVTWDDPSSAIKCTWNYFNVTTDFMKTNMGGNRTRSKIGVTNYGNESYYDYISECSCTNYKYDGNTNYGGL